MTPSVPSSAGHADLSRLWDVHCHTEYAHCATSVTALRDIEGARRAGLGGVVLTEHSFSLYEPDNDKAWAWGWRDPAAAKRLWDARGRMDDYLADVGKLRSERVLLGIEVDLLDDGGINLAPEDRDHWDLVVGAVHSLGDVGEFAADGEIKRRFIADTEALARSGIDVLAHPFRWFIWRKKPMPADLFDEVVEICRAHNVAAEINCHARNVNDPDFFSRCRRAGVKIALGTDAHAVEEIANFTGHLAVLAAIGVGPDDYDKAIYTPRPRRGRDSTTSASSA